MAILIKQKGNNNKNKPYYILTLKYMIGDSDGKDNRKVEIDIENPHIERFVKLIKTLEPKSGEWGYILEEDTIETLYISEKLNKDDYNFLMATMFEGAKGTDDSPYDHDEDEYLYDFYESVSSYSSYSTKRFKKSELIYIDENGKEFETNIIDD